MKETFQFLLDATKMLWGTGWFFVFFLASAVIILIIEKNKQKKLAFALFPILFAVCINNPVTVIIVKKVFWGTAAYFCRFFSIIPITFIIGYGMVLVIKRFKGILQPLFTVAMLACIVIGGKFYYSEACVVEADNIENVPSDVIELCDTLHSDDKVITIAVPESLSSYIRQYDASFVMPYGREIWFDWANELKKKKPDVSAIMQGAGAEGCDYVVVKSSKSSKKLFKQSGYTPVFATDNYTVYQVENVRRIVKSYNEMHQIIAIQYVDENNQFCTDQNGCAKILYTYDADGNIFPETHLDINGNPINLNP